ncbi:MAG: gamma subclass chorismate mutase AroQ [Rariglobus sp.]
MKRRAFLLSGLCAGLFLLAGCCTPSSTKDEPLHSRLVKGMAARLEIAREVAWTKAQTGAPVLDVDREKALLAALVKQGEAAGLSRDRVEKFFSAQIAASREVQTELLAAWAAGTAERPRTAPLDLRTQIRPRLDSLSNELIEALAAAPVADEYWWIGVREISRRALLQRGFSDTVSEIASGGL